MSQTELVHLLGRWIDRFDHEERGDVPRIMRNSRVS